MHYLKEDQIVEKKEDQIVEKSKGQRKMSYASQSVRRLSGSRGSDGW